MKIHNELKRARIGNEFTKRRRALDHSVLFEKSYSETLKTITIIIGSPQ